jgi:hypothetical protein
MVFALFDMNVLLIEDDRRIAGLVERGLKEDVMLPCSIFFFRA